MRQVREDFLKFIPFSFFLIVPGMELLLPAWLMVFPNSKPSQWSSEAEQHAKFLETKTKKHNAAAKLLDKIPKMLYKLEKDTAIHPDDIKKIKELKMMMQSETFLPTDLLKYRSLFKKYLNFYTFETRH